MKHASGCVTTCLGGINTETAAATWEARMGEKTRLQNKKPPQRCKRTLSKSTFPATNVLGNPDFTFVSITVFFKRLQSSVTLIGTKDPEEQDEVLRSLSFQRSKEMVTA
ncbi:hypothetical protein YC2023_112492 [Brassica napus]